VRAEAPFPESEGPAAIDGTRTHSLLERAVKFEFVDKQGQCGTLPYWNLKVEDEYGSYTVDADRAGRINVALEHIRGIVEERGGTVIPETRVFPDGLVGRADMHGTVDVQITGKFIYTILDYKDGMNPVSAVNNPQLELYALGVLAGLAPENYPKKFELVIVQPKLKMKGLPIISTHVITTEDLLKLVPVIVAQAAATDDPNAPLVPGEAQCKYCKAKGTCSAIARQAMEGIGAMFNPVNPAPTPAPAAVPSFAVPSFLAAPRVDTSAQDAIDYAADKAAGVAPVFDFATPGMVAITGPAISPEVMPAGVPDMAHILAARDPNKMDDDQLRQLMEAAPLVNQLLEGVKKEIERRLHSGKTVKGFKLVQGKGSREWALPEEEMVKKFVGMGIPKSAIYTQKMISPAQAEKLVWDKKGEPCSLSDQQKKRMETEYIKKVPGAPVVVPESDSRPAIGPMDASSLFAPVGDAAPAAPPAAPVPSFLAAPKPSFL
jgi:hypothetical protein